MFSKSCEYAIKAMIFLWQREPTASKWAGLQEISDGINSPAAYTSKILQQLARAELILSVRGPKGGFSKLENDRVTLTDIVRAIDGEKVTHKCILGFTDCNTEHPCALHFKFVEIREKLNKVLSESSINELGDLVETGKVFLK